MVTITQSNIKDEVIKAIQDVLSLGRDHLTEENQNLEQDLGADSLDSIEVVMHLEEVFNIEIPDSEISGKETVGDIIKLVESKIN